MAEKEGKAIHVRVSENQRRELERAWKASGIDSFSAWVRVALRLEARQPRIKLR